jgi:hypothetical protein
VDLGTLARVLLRRWPVVLVIAVLTAVTAWGVGRSIDPSYEAKAAVLLLAPTSDIANPYSGTTRGLESTATALALVMNGPEVVGLLRDSVPGVSYSVTAAEANAILGVEVVGTEPDLVLRAQDEILEEIHAQLIERQTDAGIRQRDLVRDSVLTKSTSPSIRFGSRDRALAAVTLLGVLAIVAAAILAERIAIRRSARRLIKETQAASEPVPVEPLPIASDATPVAKPLPLLDDPSRT